MNPENLKTLGEMRAVEVEKNVLGWYFITYVDGKEDLGSTVIEAYGPADAALRSSEAGVDPGRGSIRMTTVAPVQLPPADKRGRFLTPAEVKGLWPAVAAATGEGNA